MVPTLPQRMRKDGPPNLYGLVKGAPPAWTRRIELRGLPSLKIQRWAAQSFWVSQTWATRRPLITIKL